MLNWFKGNGLFAFSDPAGAKACLAWSDILKKEKVNSSCKLVSNKNYNFFSQFESVVDVIDSQAITSYINSLPAENIDWIFVGTSHPNSSGCFELNFIAFAQRHRIKSFAFIDHWTNFRLRFEKESCLILPEVILVLDTLAADLAEKDGLPRAKLTLFPNPYLQLLQKYQQSTLKKDAFLAIIGATAQQKIVLYAPDPISLRSQQAKNEIKILQEIIDIQSVNDKIQFHLVLKLHPLQPRVPLLSLIENKPSIIIIEDGMIQPIDLFYHVDCIIGFYSNFLIEAKMVNPKIIRYTFEDTAMDYLQHLGIGVKVSHADALKQAITTIYA